MQAGDATQNGGLAAADGPTSASISPGAHRKLALSGIGVSCASSTERPCMAYPCRRPMRRDKAKVTAMAASEMASSSADILAAAASSNACTRS
jgi:hypothetical protein